MMEYARMNSASTLKRGTNLITFGWFIIYLNLNVSVSFKPKKLKYTFKHIKTIHIHLWIVTSLDTTKWKSPQKKNYIRPLMLAVCSFFSTFFLLSQAYNKIFLSDLTLKCFRHPHVSPGSISFFRWIPVSLRT